MKRIMDVKNVVGILDIYEKKGDKLILLQSKENVMTITGLQNFLAGLTPSQITFYEVGHFAIGDGATAVDVTDTIIQGEYFRKAISDVSLNSGVSYEETVFELDLESGEGNGTIRKVGLVAHGPTTTLGNYNAADPDESGHEWRLSNTFDVLLPNGKVKDNTIVLKFIWRIRLNY